MAKSNKPKEEKTNYEKPKFSPKNQGLQVDAKKETSDKKEPEKVIPPVLNEEITSPEEPKTNTVFETSKETDRELSKNSEERLTEKDHADKAPDKENLEKINPFDLFESLPEESKQEALEVAKVLLEKNGFTVRKNDAPVSIHNLDLSSIPDAKEENTKAKAHKFFEQNSGTVSAQVSHNHKGISDPLDELMAKGREIVSCLVNKLEYQQHKRINANIAKMTIEQMGMKFSPSININDLGCCFYLRGAGQVVRFPENDQYIGVM